MSKGKKKATKPVAASDSSVPTELVGPEKIVAEQGRMSFTDMLLGHLSELSARVVFAGLCAIHIVANAKTPEMARKSVSRVVSALIREREEYVSDSGSLTQEGAILAMRLGNSVWDYIVRAGHPGTNKDKTPKSFTDTAVGAHLSSEMGEKDAKAILAKVAKRTKPPTKPQTGARITKVGTIAEGFTSLTSLITGILDIMEKADASDLTVAEQAFAAYQKASDVLVKGYEACLAAAKSETPETVEKTA